MTKLFRSEVDKLDTITTSEKTKVIREQKIKDYENSPKLCKCCNEPLLYKQRLNTFCSSSCSAIITNSKRKKDKKLNICQGCGCQTVNFKYCNNKCQGRSTYERSLAYIEDWTDTKKLRIYLIRTRGHSCECCKNDTWNCVPIPLEMDHIDGDSTNNKLNNLRMLCPNCHALTPTYKYKNVGRGTRTWRNKRYAEGKSY